KSAIQPFRSVPAVPLGFVTTVSFREPGGRTGIVALIVVSFWTLTPLAGTPPTVTVAPFSKSIPVRVTAVPPDAGPGRGDCGKTSRCENSDVLPLGSVAVAVTIWPG